VKQSKKQLNLGNVIGEQQKGVSKKYSEVNKNFESTKFRVNNNSESTKIQLESTKRGIGCARMSGLYP
jgi:hypothetical protein